MTDEVTRLKFWLLKHKFEHDKGVFGVGKRRVVVCANDEFAARRLASREIERDRNTKPGEEIQHPAEWSVWGDRDKTICEPLVVTAPEVVAIEGWGERKSPAG